ncbi:bifunctional hydroxymethylpyrimidine kinase/phosphomethylpyrimidine kinase [Liquorilactobacillus sicerae]|uniref:bifunctional hydroxymethylpyrimidine kinase/phosphomethylpyrimidine kinase n=1 Tax=Liquorilactobacillus sicerae TaxID=1416943 RepID=UPI00247FD645|nr:bifunctional hydroxymethylpyrimidine kinase/phosphomethylpyrimidine kinase [Liquorilactobacillus sicerae]
MVEEGHLLIAEDFSAVGQLSMTAALPIMAAMAIPTASWPTNLLSTQTEGFGLPQHLETKDWIEQTQKHWQQVGLKLGGILIGYFDQEEIAQQLWQQLSLPSLRLRVVDPVMADEGKFYPEITAKHLQSLKRLCLRADVITPNLTEAGLLTGISYLACPDEAVLVKLLKNLNSLQPPNGKAVITGVVKNHQIGCCWLEQDQLQLVTYPCLPGHFYGSGDVFATLLTGFLWKNFSWSAAIKQAAALLYETLKQQANQLPQQRRFGIDLGYLLPRLITNLHPTADN